MHTILFGFVPGLDINKDRAFFSAFKRLSNVPPKTVRLFIRTDTKYLLDGALNTAHFSMVIVRYIHCKY